MVSEDVFEILKEANVDKRLAALELHIFGYTDATVGIISPASACMRLDKLEAVVFTK